MKKYILGLVMALCFSIAMAKPIDDARTLYKQGDYEGAITKLKSIIKATPKDGTANYYLGLCYIGLEEPEKAKAPMEIAQGRGVADASRQLALISMGEYDLDKAQEYIEEWEKQLKKDKKASLEGVAALRSQLVNMRNMLTRVEKIVIVDSIVVPADDFFKHYRLSADAGVISDASVLPASVPAKPKVVYSPMSHKELFWADRDENDRLRIVSANVLDDGSVDDPVMMSEDLNEGGDADYMFLMPDGMTFYFANNGENSIGGYDIFMSRRDTDGTTLQPQNIGLPYNSPYDDYMLVLDEETGLGWWATDRNQIPGKVTIYVFKINDSRVNYDADDPDLADYAFIRSIKATQPEGFDKEDVFSNPVFETAKGVDAPKAFALSMGDGRIYTSLGDFKNEEAAVAMQQYLGRLDTVDGMEQQLEQLRGKYASGDKSVAKEITVLEKRLQATRPVLLNLQNSIISQERGLK